jgi:hypothetical protein
MGVMNRTFLRWLLLVVALIGLGIMLAQAPLTRIPFWGIDIYTFRAAAKAMMLGADPYYEANILRFADGVKVGNIHNFIYAPYFAFALRPLAWLSPESASRIWFALNLILFFSSVGLLFLALRWAPSPRTFLAVMGGLVLFAPLRTTLIIGQSTILLLFFLSLSLYLFHRQQPLVSGLGLSLGLFKPHLFPLLLFFGIYRRWRWLLGAGLGLAILSLPFLNQLDDWFVAATTTRSANLASSQCFQMVSLTSLLNCTLPWPDWLMTGLLGIVSLALFVWIWRLSPPGDDSSAIWAQAFERRLAVFITLSLLLIDHTRIADQMLLVFPLLVVWRDWHVLKGPFARRLALALTLVIYVVPYSLDSLGGRQVAFLLPFWYIGLSGTILGLLFLQQWEAYHEPADN